MLFDPARHEALTETPWREPAARAAIERIVADAKAAYSKEGLWPIHPLDRSPERADPLKPIYYGAAGVVWALLHLQRAGVADADDYLPAVATLLERHREDSLRLTGAPILAYPTGDAGIALLHWTMAPSQPIADELYRVIEANAAHASLGFGWGGPGSMLAALFMFERTQQPRWKTLYLSIFDDLWRCWNFDERSVVTCGCTISTAFVSNASAGCTARPRRCRACCAAGRCCRRIVHTSSNGAPRRLWWPPRCVKDRSRTGRSPRIARIAPEFSGCSIAVGHRAVVNCLASLPRDPDTDELLIAGGELAWRAGPTVKLPSLCHGAPGSGYAFLKLHARTGDERWLQRARQFAMHGIEQAERGVRQHGQRKFSLWTGDLGLAVFLCDCIRADARFPTLDTF